MEEFTYTALFILYVVYQLWSANKGSKKKAKKRRPSPQQRAPQPQAETPSKEPTLEDILKELTGQTAPKQPERNVPPPVIEKKIPVPQPSAWESSEPTNYQFDNYDILDTVSELSEVDADHSSHLQERKDTTAVIKHNKRRNRFTPNAKSMREAVIYAEILNTKYF